MAGIVPPTAAPPADRDGASTPQLQRNQHAVVVSSPETADLVEYLKSL